MAKLEKTIYSDIEYVAEKIKETILNKSMSASFEDESRFEVGNAKCIVMVFERYSYMGGNRVSMNVTLFQANLQEVHLSAITSGGSQAVLFKMNTIGENAFLDTLREVVDTM